jgi:hypothetical protein
MKWTYNALGLQQPLTWAEWTLMACVFFLLIVAGWVLVEFVKIALNVIRRK